MRYKHIAVVGVTLITTVCLLAGLMYYFNQDSCPMGTFPCKNSTLCIAQRNQCNQKLDCPDGDDEGSNCLDTHGDWDWFKSRDWSIHRDHVCDTNHIPLGCKYDDCEVTCTGHTKIPESLSMNITTLDLSNNSIKSLPTGAFAKYSELRRIVLESNNITEIEVGTFVNLTRLIWLLLTDNKLTQILPGYLKGLTNLESLTLNRNRITVANLSDLKDSRSFYLIDLSDNLLTSDALILPELPSLREILLNKNRFESIPDSLATGCPALKTLSMQDNFIKTIKENQFGNLENLVEINLSYNKIENVPPQVFQPLKNLTMLLIGNNHIHSLPMTVLEPLVRLRSLGIESINLDNLEKDAFNKFKELDFVYFKKFHYCATYAPKVQRCQPASDGVSSLSHLLDKHVLRTSVWIISCVTCMGNVLVLWGRFTSKDENRVLTTVIKNLAVSDMLMGIYLFIIAVTDVWFRDNYNLYANMWMSSWFCIFLGILAMTSSEVSVLILSFMSVERFMLIAAPLKGHRTMTPQGASTSMIIIWIIGITLALVPAIHYRSSTSFYGVNGMCFPLHIDDPYLIGWEYSAFIFLGVNLTGLMTIGYVYAGMFASIWRTRHATRNLSVGDSEFALRFFLIVFTDAACWVPIMILKIRAMMKYPVPADLHAWIVVFILPVNSAVNPLLYTFTTPKFRERLNDGWFGKMRNYVTRQPLAQDSQVSTTSNKNVMLRLSAGSNVDTNIPPIFGCSNGKVTSEKHDHIL